MATLVLFDIDGTLVYPRGIGRAVTERAMLEMFGTCGALATYEFRGRTDWETLLELLMPLGLERADIESKLPAYRECAARHFVAMADQFNISACAGGLELVAALRQRSDALIGLVTGNVETIAPLKLSAAGYDPAHFRLGAYGSEAHDRALLPPIALKRAEALHGGPFERVVIIGDTPNDIICARSIDARCIAVATGTFNREALQSYEPFRVLDSLVDLDSTLDAIFSA